MSNRPSADRDDTPVSPERGEQQLKLLIGRVAAGIGIIIFAFSVISLFFSQGAAAADISGGAVALGLGVVGYGLGARRIGLAALILGGVAVFLSLAATQGIIPGIPEGKENLFEGSPGNPEP